MSTSAVAVVMLPCFPGAVGQRHHGVVWGWGEYWIHCESHLAGKPQAQTPLFSPGLIFLNFFLNSEDQFYSKKLSQENRRGLVEGRNPFRVLHMNPDFEQSSWVMSCGWQTVPVMKSCPGYITRGTCWVASSINLHLLLWDRISRWSWSSSFLLDCLCSVPRDLSPARRTGLVDTLCFLRVLGENSPLMLAQQALTIWAAA